MKFGTLVELGSVQLCGGSAQLSWVEIFDIHAQIFLYPFEYFVAIMVNGTESLKHA